MLPLVNQLFRGRSPNKRVLSIQVNKKGNMENLQYLSGERFSYVFFFSKTLTRPSLSSSLAKFLAIAMEIIVFYCLKIAYSIMCDDMSVYKGNDSAV